MKNVILSPNPYRDKNFRTVREAVRILSDAGIQSRVCLPFEVDKSFELPRDIRFSRLYGRRGPILNCISAEPCEPLTGDDRVATFY